MSTCVATTSKGKRCGYSVRQYFGQRGVCGIKAHVKQVQKLARVEATGCQNSPPPPDRPVSPGVSPLLPIPIVVAGLTRRPAATVRTINSCDRKYTVIGELGSGAYGRVYEVEYEGQRYAIKQQQSKASFTHISVPALVEADIMNRCFHPNIIKLYNVFFDSEEDTMLNYVMERADRQLRGIGVQSAASLKSLAFQLLSAVDFLHQHQIIHADIKPENILLTRNTDTDSPHVQCLKLADFGLSQYNLPQEKSLEVQTYWYRAPEVFKRDTRYNTAVDMWSVGLILYELVVRTPLLKVTEGKFLAGLEKVLGARTDSNALVRRARPESASIFSAEEWLAYTDLMNRCLTFDPRRRITASDALKSSLFAGFEPVIGSYYYTEQRSAPPAATFEQYELLEHIVNDNNFYNSNSLVLAIDLYDRVRPELEGSSSEIALGCLDLALKLNQRCSLSLTTFRTLLKDPYYGSEEIWVLESQIATALDFRLYYDNVALICAGYPSEVVYGIHRAAHRAGEDTRDFETLCARILSAISKDEPRLDSGVH